MYDSLYPSIDDKTRMLLQNLFTDEVTVKIEACPKQIGVDDCGVYAIAMSTALATSGQSPQSFTQNGMRSHLVQCFTDHAFSIFP